MRGLKLLGMGLLLVSAAAQAELTGTGTVTSDYEFRGISQSAEDPALQGSIDWANDGGFYAGAWASNVDFGPGSESDIEVDGYVGIAGGEEGGVGWDVGLVYYSYWPDDDDINYAEIYAGVTFNVFGVKFWYSDDYVNLGESAYYIEGSAQIPLPQDFTLGLHAGISDGDAFVDSITDYAVGVSKTFGNFDVELKYVDTDLDDTGSDVLSGKGRVVLAVSTTFPWGAE